MSLIETSQHLGKHLTVTGYTRHEARSRMLMVFHRKLGRRLPPGGHVDADEYPSDAVLREVAEETAVHAVHAPRDGLALRLSGVVDEQLPTPLSMSAQLIPATPDAEEHIHIDMMSEVIVADDVSDGDIAVSSGDTPIDFNWYTQGMHANDGSARATHASSSTSHTSPISGRASRLRLGKAQEQRCGLRRPAPGPRPPETAFATTRSSAPKRRRSVPLPRRSGGP